MSRNKRQMERHALTSRFNIMHFPFHFSQHHFKVCIGMHLEIEFSARYTTDFSYPPIIFFYLLFIYYLLVFFGMQRTTETTRGKVSIVPQLV